MVISLIKENQYTRKVVDFFHIPRIWTVLFLITINLYNFFLNITYNFCYYELINKRSVPE